MYKYHKPSTVLSPQRSISKVDVIFDGGAKNDGLSFSLAKVTWQGSITNAIRWNVTNGEWSDPSKMNGSVICVGEPNSRGYPTWFILPDSILGAIITTKGEVADSIRKILPDSEVE